MPRRVLHLLDSINFSAATTRVGLLCDGLPADQFQQQVAALRLQGGAMDRIRQSGVEMHDLRQRHAVDPFVWLRLKRLLAHFRPDVVHAWSPAAARYARHAGAKLVDESQLGAPFGVPLDQTEPIERKALGLPEGCRLIGVVSRMIPSRRVKDLLWAFDLVRVLHDDARLVVVGDGPHRPALQRFASLACQEDRILFLGDRADVPQLLSHFQMLWAADPTKANMVLVEAMAAGLPIVCDAGCDCVASGDSAVRVPPGDRAARAKAACRLLDDSTLRKEMGQAARRQAEQRFPLIAMLDACAAAYARGG